MHIAPSTKVVFLANTIQHLRLAKLIGNCAHSLEKENFKSKNNLL